MALTDRFPKDIFTTRGWGLLATGGVFLLAAQTMGRRDLLALAILLVVLPLFSLAGTRLLKPNFSVFREFTPASVETAATATVLLAVARTGAGSGHALMEEHLPARFGESPAFRFPARSATGATSRYEYHVRSGKRGQFRIGPVTAEFSDPFGLSLQRHAIDDGDILTVTPAAVELPATGLAGARGHDGVTATRIRANPSDDDVMTREYRHGDPMRRVHWAATARHGELMVRQEESVTTPEATIILDQRRSAFTRGTAGADGHEPVTSDAFEWAVTAAVSVGAHLAERNYALRFLDAAGEPAFRHSPSAPEPESEEYLGATGLQSIAESLAAIQLTGPHASRRDGAGAAGPRTAGHRHPAGAEAGPQPFDDRLMDKLAAHRMRGPVLAILGEITPAEARTLSAAAGFAANAFALVITERSAQPMEVLEILRLGGWRAVAVIPSTPLTAAWAAFDDGGTAPLAAAADVRRGTGARR
ncbi:MULTISPECIES: DUF58 domain-containing protein [unclassified Arthrobacter]|uniref:DUF58 domain-containing protein n=1 Tax=unclassified Arthrobacter TaxID=235627 RepID=UPI002DFAC5B9|nr:MULTISPECIES: DUF58 domain-containing protein [unclassified Arthrobacter]MEC5190361.1 uncharacterized protein (DUF58 family) [Arthrobacter sp. MP_M4]MEC5201712.1 uncharacterized protein (DUF58 family) [Arthrobacter sp. MP_M7]